MDGDSQMKNFSNTEYNDMALNRKYFLFDSGYPILPTIPRLVQLLFKNYTKEVKRFNDRYKKILDEVDDNRTIESSTFKVHKRTKEL